MLYMLMVFISGFLFSRRLSIIAGFFGGIQYFLLYLVGKEYVDQIEAPGEIMQQSLVNPALYIFKTIFIMASGFTVGIYAGNVRTLIGRILDEQEEKINIDKIFGQYVSKEIKNKNLKEKLDVIGERKNVVVLFSDIRSFSNYSEMNDPEQVVKRLNEYFDRMVACIAKNEGIVNKFIGDSIMAVFGGLLEVQNPCDAALLAAIDMQKELHKLNKKWQKEGLPPFEHGVGLHYGEVLEGTIGSENRKEFTVIGNAVNTADRLERATKTMNHNVIVSLSVYKNLSNRAKKGAHDFGKISVKGINKPIHVYGFKP